MKTLKLTIKDRLAILTLDREKSNALNREMVMELSEVFSNITNDPQIGGVLITGKDKFFSAGLDLIEIFNYSEEDAKSFWQLFLNFTKQLISFKKPLIAAINGHSPAGGCVIALASDARIMADGKFIIGLNEIPVGIIIPQTIFKLYAFWLGHANATKSLLSGKLFNPNEALEIGLIDEICNAEQLLTICERKIRKLMAFESNTWEQSKLNIRKDLLNISQSDENEELETMLKQWWHPNTRQILKTIIDGLKNKSN